MAKEPIKEKYRIIAKNMLFGAFDEATILEKFVIQKQSIGYDYLDFWTLKPTDSDSPTLFRWDNFSSAEKVIQSYYNSEEEALAALRKYFEIREELVKKPRVVKEIEI